MTEQEAFDAHIERTYPDPRAREMAAQMERDTWQAALAWAATQQEPVAWLLDFPGSPVKGAMTCNAQYARQSKDEGAGITPLYTHPAPDRLRKALEAMTRTEPCDCGCPEGTKPVALKPAEYYAIARAALAKGE